MSLIRAVIEGRRHDLGAFEVDRILPHPQCRAVGPFVFFDHFGPTTMAAGLPKSADVRPHPHIGLSTVSYLFQGQITHRDSVGSLAEIHPGEVNWMTAGRGITHSERFEALRAAGGPMHGVQAWVALPTALEEIDPAFAHHGPEDLPTYEVPGLWARLIAGEAFAAKAAVKVHSPMFYAHWRLGAGAVAALPAEYSERAVFVASGVVRIEGSEIGAGRMVLLAPGETVPITGIHDAEVLLLGGESVGERIVEWNFVSSSKARIDQAKADWRAGRMKLPDLDSAEFIPLPPDPPPPANPIS